MICKGICETYQAKLHPRMGRYKRGDKRCQICQIFIKWEGVHCPCCGTKLRTKPRGRINKEILRELQK